MTRSTLIAVAAFCALGLAFLATREPQVAVGVRKLTLPALKADAITSVQLGDLTLSEEGGGWTVARGAQRFPADPAAVAPLTQALAELKAADFVTDQADQHAGLGVDGASGRVVKASTATGAARDLLLGSPSKSGGTYLRQAGANEVFVVQGRLGALARQELTAWRLKRIELPSRDQVERVTLTPAGREPLVMGVAAAEVTLEGPPQPGYRFDGAAANRLVGQLLSLAAQDFIEAPVTAPAFTISLGLKGGATRTLSLGARRPDGTAPLSVEGDPQGYVVPGWVADALQKDREGLRDLQLFAVTALEAERATLTAGTRKVVLEKQGDVWAVVEPKALPAGFEFDPGTVEAQLRQLLSTRAVRVAADVSDARAGLTKPAATLEVKAKGGEVRRVVVGAKVGDAAEHYARGQDAFPVVIPASALSSLERGLELFKRQPPPQPMGLDQLPPEIRAQIEAQLRQQR